MDKFGNYILDLNTAATTAANQLYECPPRAAIDVGSVTNVTASAQVNNTQTQVASIIINEYAGGTPTVTIWKNADSGSVPSAAAEKIYVNPMTANENLILNLGLLLTGGDTLWASASVVDQVIVTINYIEIS